MPWRGDKENLIDRFDVRANLDFISEAKLQPLQLSKDEMIEERRCNYERYKSGNYTELDVLSANWRRYLAMEEGETLEQLASETEDSQ